MSGYIRAMQRYFEFGGRSRRSEYWFFVLFLIIFSVVAGVLDYVLGIGDPTRGVGVLGGIVSLVHLIPAIAVSVRRLHDIDRTGWWLLISFVPLIGAIVLIIFYVTRGTPGTNRFGPPEF
jgi:uncharacterized membrane protein YhaH (DUF805 family)